MEEITEYILNLLEILEKELLLFKFTAAKTIKGLGWFIMGVFLLAAGVLLLGWTCFTAVSQLIGPVAAGLVTSVIVLMGGGFFLWRGGRNLK